MIEVISILLFVLGISLSWILFPVFVKQNYTYSKILVAIFFLLLWNSEFLATCILFSAVLFYMKNKEEIDLNHIESLLKHFLFALLFSFIFRKLKDASMQYLIEINL